MQVFGNKYLIIPFVRQESNKLIRQCITKLFYNSEV